MKNSKVNIVLASQSPRRNDLLLEAGYKFRVSPVKVSETIDENLNPPAVAESLARLKAEAAFAQHKYLESQGFLVLACDTLVTCEGRILGKPQNNSTASETLRFLSAKTHSVISGLCLVESHTKRLWLGHDETKVEFSSLSEVEIKAYVETGEGLDKAGAYGIQGLGGKFVSRYTGSWSNVVGLPLETLQMALEKMGWDVERTRN